MIPSFIPRMDILPPAQQKLWPELKPATPLGFVLYGGTALALRLGHRTSVDFDFFADAPLNHEVLRRHFSFFKQATVLQDERNALSILVPCGDAEHSHVKVSFFGAIGIGRVGEPAMTQDGVLQVASLEDLMATKVKVVLQRAEAKDYRDIAAMIRSGVSLADGLAAARELFGPNFQPSESMKALIFFNDGDLNTLTESEKKILIDATCAIRTLHKAVIRSNQLT